MATLVSDIINQAFLDLNVVAPGEGITTAEQTDAFLRLNQMIASWSREQLTVPQLVHQIFTPTAGTFAYTLGTGGTLASSSAPVRVTGATSYSGNFRSPVRIVSHEEFGATVGDDAGSTAVLVKVLAADGDSPNINVRLWPTPAAGPGSLEITYWAALAAFATVGDSVTLPEGFEDALHFNLAVRLYPQYGRQGGIDQVLASNAQTTKAALVQLNAQILGQKAAQ